MENYETSPGSLIKKLRQNLDRLEKVKKVSLSEAPRSCGAYMLYFGKKVQYIGYSSNLYKRIGKKKLHRKNHTVINKLCVLKRFKERGAVRHVQTKWKAKLIETETPDDAKILEAILIAAYCPYYNKPLQKLLRELKKQGHPQSPAPALKVNSN